MTTEMSIELRSMLADCYYKKHSACYKQAEEYCNDNNIELSSPHYITHLIEFLYRDTELINISKLLGRYERISRLRKEFKRRVIESHKKKNND